MRWTPVWPKVVQEDYGTMRAGDRILCGEAQAYCSSDLQKDGDDPDWGTGGFDDTF